MTKVLKKVNDSDITSADTKAMIEQTVAALQPLVQQIHRLEAANDLAKQHGFVTGQKDDTVELRSMRATIAFMCRQAVWLSEGSPRFPEGTGEKADKAEWRHERELERNGGDSPELDKLHFQRQITGHLHNNCAKPLADWARAVFEALMGEPMVDRPVEPVNGKGAKQARDMSF